MYIDFENFEFFRVVFTCKNTIHYKSHIFLEIPVFSLEMHIFKNSGFSGVTVFMKKYDSL